MPRLYLKLSHEEFPSLTPKTERTSRSYLGVPRFKILRLKRERERERSIKYRKIVAESEKSWEK
jgi:hypothetical protein